MLTSYVTSPQTHTGDQCGSSSTWAWTAWQRQYTQLCCDWLKASAADVTHSIFVLRIERLLSCVLVSYWLSSADSQSLLARSNVGLWSYVSISYVFLVSNRFPRRIEEMYLSVRWQCLTVCTFTMFVHVHVGECTCTCTCTCRCLLSGGFVSQGEAPLKSICPPWFFFSIKHKKS